MLRWSTVLGGLSAFLLLFSAGASAHRLRGHRSHSLYVQAGAATGGNGSRQAPLDSLAAAESTSVPGETIYVLPAETALDGGILLQPGQRLVGLGPQVTVDPSGASAQITNSSAAENGGDAVVLADNTTVENIHVVGANAAGIVGQDVTEAHVIGNLITGFNQSQTIGAVGFLGLDFGQAGIDIRADGSTVSTADIRNNIVADAPGNGTMFRTADSADLTITMEHNSFHDLTRASSLPSGNFGFVEAIFFDSVGASTLNLDVDHLFVNNIGSDISNSDAIFSTLDGTSKQSVNFDHYTYRDTSGVGGSRASAGEYVTGEPTALPGSSFSLTIANSDIEGAPQEGLQIDDFGTGEHVSVTVKNTVYRDVGHTTVPDPSEQPHTVADCVEIGPRNPANGSTYQFNFTDDQFLDCGYNGIQIWDGPVTLTPIAAANVADMSLNLTRDVFAHAGYAGLFLNNVGTIDHFSLRAARTSFVDNGTDGIDLDDETVGATAASSIDLGGGSLNSPGGNRIVGNADAAIAANSNFDVIAKRDWWGSPSGPDPASLLVTQNADVQFTPFLTRDPWWGR
jgi:hypothetical protein